MGHSGHCRNHRPAASHRRRYRTERGLFGLGARLPEILEKDYIAVEDVARKAGRGPWRGKFIAPWEWRRGKRLASEAANDNQSCPIKGNIGKRGTRVYHGPGGAYYSRTKINEAKGERWFCSEGQAHASGWRRSKR